MPIAPVTIPDSAAPSTPTSLGAKLLNMFVCPAEVFDEVLAAPPQSATWRVPTLLVCLTGIVLLLATTNQQPIPTSSAPAWNFGKLSIAEIQVLSGAEPLVSGLALCVCVFAGGFCSASVLCFIGRVFLRTHFEFRKALELVGLTSIILVLGTIITML